ncbi:MAG TPA: WD40 repeat domain-containing protein [Candidatus Babeliales bacterium]|nr:WD40 repeat domain-containing protein [Candidatus Babeliales bacterium]
MVIRKRYIQITFVSLLMLLAHAIESAAERDGSIPEKSCQTYSDEEIDSILCKVHRLVPVAYKKIKEMLPSVEPVSLCSVDVEALVPEHRIESLHDCAVSQNGQFVVKRSTVFCDGEVKCSISVFDISGEPTLLDTWVEAGKREMIDSTALAVSSDGKTVVMGIKGGGMCITEVGSGGGKSIFCGNGYVKDIMFSGDDTAILADVGTAIVGWDYGNLVKKVLPCKRLVWDALTGKLRAKLGDYRTHVASMAINHDGARAAVAVSDPAWPGTLCFDATTGEKLYSNGTAAYKVAFSPDGQSLAAVGENAINVYNSSGEMTQTIDINQCGRGKNIKYLSFPHPSRLITAGLGNGGGTEILVRALEKSGRIASAFNMRWLSWFGHGGVVGGGDRSLVVRDGHERGFGARLKILRLRTPSLVRAAVLAQSHQQSSRQRLKNASDNKS